MKTIKDAAIDYAHARWPEHDNLGNRINTGIGFEAGARWAEEYTPVAQELPDPKGFSPRSEIVLIKDEKTGLECCGYYDHKTKGWESFPQSIFVNPTHWRPLHRR